MDKISGIFSQPYSNESWQESLLKKLLRSFGEGTFISVFLIVFQPFGISYWQDPNKVYYLLGFGVITVLTGSFIRVFLPPLLPKFFDEERWTVGREIFIILLLLFFIAVNNFLYQVVFLYTAFEWNNFVWSVFTVVLVGVFPVAFAVFTNYIYQLKKYQKPISVKTHEDNAPQIFTLVAENEKDTFAVAHNNLLFIESADNYAVINYLENNTVMKELLRSSLTRLESQINSENIVRCHRSFIVNLNKVAEVTGNAQGYKFHLQAPELTVPVARKYSELVKRIS
ncbi:MAG: LytTR family transcriptional regulator [Spirosomaceae bacterium]|nr:LytTR family transcriptional regulator [Spirosomataceae bacterium]